MSEKLEEIKKLQDELFKEEYGVTKEQARKLNEFIFHAVSTRFGRMNKEIDEQNERISELEWEHKKLCISTWSYIIVSIAIYIFILAVIK